MNEEQSYPSKLLLDINEVAAILGIGRSLAYAYVMRGEIRSLKLGRLRKVPVDAVHEFIARQAKHEGEY